MGEQLGGREDYQREKRRGGNYVGTPNGDEDSTTIYHRLRASDSLWIFPDLGVTLPHASFDELWRTDFFRYRKPENTTVRADRESLA